MMLNLMMIMFIYIIQLVSRVLYFQSKLYKNSALMRVTIIIMIINIRHGRGSLFDYGDQFYDNDDFEYDDDYDDQ